VEGAAVIGLHNDLNIMDEIKKIGNTTYTITNIERVGALREESRRKREQRSSSDKVTLGKKSTAVEKRAIESDAPESSVVEDEESNEERHLNILI